MFFFCLWTSFVPNNYVPNFLRAGRASITPTVCREISQIKKSLKFRYAGVSKLLCVFVLGLFLRFCLHPSVENFYNLCREINFKLRAHFVEALSEAKTFREYKAVKECFARRSAFRAHTTSFPRNSLLHFSCDFFTGEIERIIESPFLYPNVCRRICSNKLLA